MAVEAQVECPECRGSGMADPVTGELNRNDSGPEGGVRTISLHNIRYELQWRGDGLWAVAAGGEELVGEIWRSADGEYWEGTMRGRLVMRFPDEGAVREGLKRYVNILLRRES